MDQDQDPIRSSHKGWIRFLAGGRSHPDEETANGKLSGSRWNMGILNDPYTIEVPGKQTAVDPTYTAVN